MTNKWKPAKGKPIRLNKPQVISCFFLSPWFPISKVCLEGIKVEISDTIKFSGVYDGRQLEAIFKPQG